MTLAINPTMDIPTSTSIFTTAVISLESKSKESVLEETVNESGIEDPHETTDNKAEMMGLPDESSQLVKELHTEEVQEGRRETTEAMARNREVQIVAPQAAKKTAVGIAVHFEDDAKITTPTRKRRDLDDFDDSERKEKRAKHVNEENERGASTPAHLTFQDTVGGENINNVRPPSPESPTTSESMASADTKPLSDKPKGKKPSLMKKIVHGFPFPRPHSKAPHPLTPPETPTRPVHKQHSQATSQFQRAAKVATDGHKLLSQKFKAVKGQKEPRKPSPRPGMPAGKSIFS